MVNKIIVSLNNSFVRLRGPKCAPGELIILIPSCLQNSQCTRKVRIDPANCRRCGDCRVGDIVGLAEEYGVRAACATGGRLALELVKDKSVRAIVAVACEKELSGGIIGAFPKPVLAVSNARPNGPCKDTTVDIEEVRKAVEYFLIGASAGETTGEAD